MADIMLFDISSHPHRRAFLRLAALPGDATNAPDPHSPAPGDTEPAPAPLLPPAPVQPSIGRPIYSEGRLIGVALDGVLSPVIFLF